MARGLSFALFATLALCGCAGDDGDHATNGDDGASSGGSGGSNASGGASGSGASSGAGGDGALPYANVTAVSATGEPGAYTFAVTIESADIDCTQFADWWEVVSDSGSLVYRRILEHSHTDENGTTDPDAPGNTFTRDGGPVAVLADDLIVVRAHMSNRGYEGMALRGSAAGGFDEAPDIDSNFAASLENDTPLPTGCLF
jgi:hypothetical protein